MKLLLKWSLFSRINYKMLSNLLYPIGEGVSKQPKPITRPKCTN